MPSPRLLILCTYYLELLSCMKFLVQSPALHMPEPSGLLLIKQPKSLERYLELMCGYACESKSCKVLTPVSQYAAASSQA